MAIVCPICNGEGQRTVIVRHPQSQMEKVVVDWCLCIKSKYVSEIPAYKLLRRIEPEEYQPLNNIDLQLQRFDPKRLATSPNLLIWSNPENLFFRNLKSIIMKYRFEDPAPSFLCCSSMDLLRDYYVQQNDGSNPQLSDVNRYDLLVFTLDNREKNDQLKTCVSQVVYNRLCIKKPTWIYMNRANLSLCTYEFSTDLEGYVSNFEEVHMMEKEEMNKEASDVRRGASGFSPIG